MKTALNFDAVPGFREAYDAQVAAGSLPGRCDLLRYLILWTYGGVYMDADVVIANPKRFDTFLQGQTATLFFAWEDFSARSLELNAQLPNYELDLKGRERLIANSVIGVQPRHPFLYKAIEGAAAYAARLRGQGAWREVGPGYMSNLYDTFEPKEGIVIHPMRFFYPVQWGGITDPEYHLKHPMPVDSMLFQYGYSTNQYNTIFQRLGPKSHIRGTFRARRGGRGRQTRRQSSSDAPPASPAPRPLDG